MWVKLFVVKQVNQLVNNTGNSLYLLYNINIAA